MTKLGRPTTLPEPWCSLAAKLGGVKALADAMGVVPLTLRRWATGEIRMSGPARILYMALCREHGLSTKVAKPE